MRAQSIQAMEIESAEEEIIDPAHLDCPRDFPVSLVHRVNLCTIRTCQFHWEPCLVILGSLSATDILIYLRVTTINTDNVWKIQ